MFSIIIPLYNKSLYIEKAIESIFAQTNQAFELIVVDDGSTDNSLELVKLLKASRFKDLKIIEQQNQGVSVARNNGVRHAKYDFIAFLDADDWWASNYLFEMVKLIEKFPEAGMYSSSYFKVKHGKNIQAKIGVDSKFSEGYFDYFKAYSKSLWMPVWTGATVVKKAAFNSVTGFNPSLTLGEDFDLWVRIALNYKTVFLNIPLAYYNQDVCLVSRAIGKLHEPEKHYLWNLECLSNLERKNIYLKATLDRLRVYVLFPYYINNKYREIAKVELDKVSWREQSYLNYLKYHTHPSFSILIQKIQNLIFKVKLFNNHFPK